MEWLIWLVTESDFSRYITPEGNLFYLYLLLGMPLILLVVFIPLTYKTQRVVPVREVVHSILVYWIWNISVSFFIALSFFFLVSTVIPTSTYAGLLSVSYLPIIVQAVIFYLIAEFGYYVLHLAMHEIPFMWHFHKVHHEEYELNWTNAFRFEIQLVALAITVSIFVVLLFDFSFVAVALALTILQILAGLSHYGNSWTFGKWGYIFLSPKAHSIHHETTLRKIKGENISVRYFAFSSSFIDTILGTGPSKT